MQIFVYNFKNNEAILEKFKHIYFYVFIYTRYPETPSSGNRKQVCRTYTEILSVLENRVSQVN